MAKQCSIPTAVKKMARSAGFETRELKDGRIKIFDKSTGARIGLASTEDEARELISKFVGMNQVDLDGALPIPASGTPLSQGVVGSQRQLAKWENFSRNFEGAGAGARSFFAFFTPPEKLFQSLEKISGFPFWNKIYEPTQKARIAFRTAMGKVERDGLKSVFGGKHTNFQDSIHELERLTRKLSPEQRRLMVLGDEAYTKGELAQAFNLSPAEVALADQIAKIGVADEIPNMIRLSAIIDDRISRSAKLQQDLPKIRNAVREGTLPADLLPQIEEVANLANEITDLKSAYDVLNLTDDQQFVMGLLRAALKDDSLNIPAIYAHSVAPVLEAGFKNGREQFAAKMGILPETRALMGERRKILDEAFKDTPFDREQLMGIQLPIFRQFIDAGLLPGKQFRDSLTGNAQKWASLLDNLPEGNELFGRRVLSGHLNPFELDPAVTTYKHVRNIMLRNHYDNVAAQAESLLKNLDPKQDAFAIRAATNYLHELDGIPAESFQRLTAMVRGIGRYMGYQVDDRIGEKLIHTLNWLSYSASIPFRPALIARNYFQTLAGVPLIGAEAWGHGIKSALGWTGADFSEQAMVEAIARAQKAGVNVRTLFRSEAKDRAIQAGALRPDLVPLHGGEALEGITEGIFGPLGPKLEAVGYKTRELFNKGFSLYRQGDDFGRVAMFEAGRHRTTKALEAFVKSSRDDAALKTLMRDAKLMHFDSTIRGEFERLIRVGQFDDAANFIGRKLADKVHFLYGDANHPNGWGGVAGKLFGQFGTFPVQYANHLTETIGSFVANGDVKGAMEFVAGHGAVNLGIIWAGAELFDADLESWAFLPSLQYTGGPYAELFLSTVGAIGGSDAERALAVSNIKMMMPWWNRPSIFTPGSYFVGDVVRAFQEDDITHTVFRATGVRFLDDRPSAVEGLTERVKNGFGWMNELLP